jgi:hypothetical protein
MLALLRWTKLHSSNFGLCYHSRIDLYNIRKTTFLAVWTNLRCPKLIHFMAIEVVTTSFLDVLQGNISLTLGTRRKVTRPIQHDIIIVAKCLAATSLVLLLSLLGRSRIPVFDLEGMEKIINGLDLLLVQVEFTSPPLLGSAHPPPNGIIMSSIISNRL